MRKPVITSSNTNNAPCSWVSSRSPSRKPASGVIKPALPTTGSRMTPAISLGFCSNRAFTASKSLKGAVNVPAATDLGTPGESGKPKVATPEPALTRNISACP